MRSRKFLPIALIVLLTALPSAPITAQQPDRALQELQGLSRSFEALSELVSPAVVQILATGYTPIQAGDPPGAGLLSRRSVSGSGVILSPDGFIITDAHVLEGAGRIRVRLAIPADDYPPGRSILKPTGRTLDARVLGVDLETDLAVLKVKESGLPYLKLGDSDELRKGQLVFAFGSPRGLENSVSMGVVSAVARQLQPEDPMIYIQTDAPINPGSSGGPLVDSQGRVVGINTLIFSQSGGSEGLGFAAPSNIVANVYRQIKTSGYVRRGEIGVNAQTISTTLAEGLGLVRDWGVVLGDVYPGSPADAAGLRVGDVVLGLDGKPMENGRHFDVQLYRRPVGDEVILEIVRGEQQLTVAVSVIERPGDMAQFSPMVNPDENLIPRLGILGLDLDQQIIQMLRGARGSAGVVVAAISPDAIYGQVGLTPGDIIYSVNGKRIKGLDGLRFAIDRTSAGDAVVLQVERRGALMFLAFEIG